MEQNCNKCWFNLLYEDGTGDPPNYFNNNITFSGVGNKSKSLTGNQLQFELFPGDNYIRF